MWWPPPPPRRHRQIEFEQPFWDEVNKNKEHFINNPLARYALWREVQDWRRTNYAEEVENAAPPAAPDAAK